ncbi:MAG: hypothetical protein C0500_14140 [Sphingobium sp.]|nr:hypothetical protein [Sphingobium sp.]
MKALTVDFGIGAARAGAIVSDIRAVLPRLLTDWENELSRKKRWRWHGGPFLVAPASDGGMTDAPVIVDQHAILRCLTDETARPKNVVISLQAMMSRVVYRVQMLVSGEELIPYLDDDTGLKVAAFNALPETYQAIMGGEA